MADRSLELELSPVRGEPIFLTIARAVGLAIRVGRLRPGAPLPGSRPLAAQLGVHRNTVLAALRELEKEGWVETSPARGTFVSARLPEPSPRALRGMKVVERDPSVVGFDLRGEEPSREALRAHFDAHVRPSPPRLLQLVGGLPDLRLLPRTAMARAYRRAVLRSTSRALGYGDPRGDSRLRGALGDLLSRTRGIARAERGLVVTRGSQMALHLAARALLAPGEIVAVEALGYRPGWEALRLAGARVVPVAMDGEGLRVDALASLCARERVRAVYVTPHHQYPTTVLLGSARRMALLALADRHRLAILEDDYDHEFQYEGRPTLPIASADDRGRVVYLGTLSKIVAPGLRVGFAVAPEPVAERMAALRTFIDRQGDLAVERAVAEMLEDGEIERHARAMRRVYEARRDALLSSIARHLGDSLELRVPDGGLAVWARVDPRLDVEAWAARALEAHVVVHTGRRFTFDGRPLGALRLGFAPVDPREIELAVKRLAEARPRRAAAPLPRRRRAAG